MATLEDHGGLPPVPEGQVKVEALDGKWAGWLRVSIGRRKYTKRFNLSAAEAAQLWELLGNTQFCGVSGELPGVLPTCTLVTALNPVQLLVNAGNQGVRSIGAVGPDRAGGGYRGNRGSPGPPHCVWRDRQGMITGPGDSPTRHFPTAGHLRYNPGRLWLCLRAAFRYISPG